jgi:hypothetical protein
MTLIDLLGVKLAFADGVANNDTLLRHTEKNKQGTAKRWVDHIPKTVLRELQGEKRRWRDENRICTIRNIYMRT